MITKNKAFGITIGAILILLSIVAFKPEDKKSETIMIRATQIYTPLGKNKSMLRIYKGKMEIEKTPLERADIENDELNFDKILSTVQTYQQAGYEIISHSETSYSNFGLINTFIMTKK